MIKRSFSGNIQTVPRGRVNKPTLFTHNPIMHAYGSQIHQSWNGADYGTAAIDTGSSILTGALSGAAIGGGAGTVLGLPGMLAGTIIGGLVGLGKGIFDGNSSSANRAKMEEQNRQITMQNMDARTQNDSMIKGFDNNPSLAFYLGGGRMNRRFALGGPINMDDQPNQQDVEPISTDTALVKGRYHSQGGVNVGPKDNVERDEMLKNNFDENGNIKSIDVYSRVLTNPQTGRTFAEDALELANQKALYQKHFDRTENVITKYKNSVADGKSDVLKVGTAQRHVQIAATKSDQILAQIGGIDDAMKSLFAMQEHLNGNDQQQDQNSVDLTQPQQAMFGRRIHADGGTYLTPRGNANPFNELVLANSFDYDPSIGFGTNKGTTLMNSSFVNDELTYGNSPTIRNNSKNNQLLIQGASGMLDSFGQALANRNMSNLPVPTRSQIPTYQLNSNIDNSRDINDINANQRQTLNFINNNVSGAQARRNMVVNVMSKTNDARSNSFFTKTNAERNIQNANIQSMQNATIQNQGIDYQNKMAAYNASMGGLNRTSAIIGNAGDKMATLGQNQAQLKQNDVSAALVLAQFPASVRARIAQQLRQGMSLSQAIGYNS